MPARSGDCVQIITDAYAGLTAGQRKVADYAMRHLEEVLYLSVSALCRRTGASEATVSRFCQALGFKGFREFKIAMAERISYFSTVLDLDRAEDGVAGNVRRALQADIQSIESTMESLDIEQAARVARRLAKANRIMFCGVGTSGIVCLDAMFKFTRLNLPVYAHTDAHIMATAIGFMGKGDVVVGISHSGSTGEVVELLKLARENRAFTVGITTYPEAPMAAFCDVVFKTMSRETPLHRVAMTSRMSQNAVVDALFMSVVCHIRPEAIGSLEKAAAVIERFR